MSERQVIHRTRMPITKEKLIEEFKLLGLQSSDTVLVHTSLSKLGYVIGGPVTVIQALQEVVHNGTIIMPTQTGDNSNPEEWKNPAVSSSWFEIIKEHMPAFEPDVTPTRGMGVVPEVFRSMPNVFRSNHPIDSFAIWGNNAKAIAASQPLTPAFGDESPLGVLIQNKGKVLLIGVGYDSCTLLHHAETKINDYPTKEVQTAMMVNGKREWSSYNDFDYTADRFNEIGDAFEKDETLSIRKLGIATIRCIDANELDEFAIQYLRNNN